MEFVSLFYYQWNPVSSPVNVNLNSFNFTSSTLIVVSNAGTVLYSSDSGINWNVVNTGVSANLYSSCGIFPSFALGASGTIIKSSNYGLNWSTVYSPTSNNLNAISNYVSQLYKIVCGDAGKIYTSTNSGTNWTDVTSGTSNTLRNIYFNSSISSYRSYICGDNGTFSKLICALPLPPVITVVPYNIGVSNNFYGVSAIGDTSNIMMVGSGGIIIKSTNGGLNRLQQVSGTTITLRTINTITSNEIFVGGDNGTIIRTTNGGTNW